MKNGLQLSGNISIYVMYWIQLFFCLVESESESGHWPGVRVGIGAGAEQSHLSLLQMVLVQNKSNLDLLVFAQQVESPKN